VVISGLSPGEIAAYYRRVGVQLGDGTDDWFRARCPNRAEHNHGDANPSAGVAKTTGFFKCQKCGLSGFADQLAARFGWPPPAWNGRGPVAGERPITDRDGRPMVCWHDYTDEGGRTLYSKARMDTPAGKEFFFWAQGSWGLKGKNIRRVPFRLHRLGKAEEVPILEGESDVLGAEELGFIATTTDNGAEGDLSVLARFLTTMQPVVVLGDEDDDGEAYRANALKSLTGRVASLKSIHLPELNPGEKDPRDWVAARRNDLQAAAERSATVIEDTEEWQPASEFRIGRASEALKPRPPMTWIVERFLGRRWVSIFFGDPGAKKPMRFTTRPFVLPWANRGSDSPLGGPQC